MVVDLVRVALLLALLGCRSSSNPPEPPGWPTLDCSAVLDTEVLANACGPHTGKLVIGPTEGEVTPATSTTPASKDLCTRMFELESSKHVVGITVAGYETRSAIDDYVRKSRRDIPSFADDKLVHRSIAAVSRTDLDATTGRFIYQVFELVPAGSTALCDDKGFRALATAVRKRLAAPHGD